MKISLTDETKILLPIYMNNDEYQTNDKYTYYIPSPF